MECLQYLKVDLGSSSVDLRFKPCYKWNAFNTSKEKQNISKIQGF